MSRAARPLRVAVIGAAGRMGRLLCASIDAAPDLELAARVDVRGVGAGGTDAPASKPGSGWAELVGYSPGLFAFAAGGIDVAVEFTRGDAPALIGPQIEKIGCAWLSGTTALTPASQAALESAGGKVPVLWSVNMSLGAAVLQMLIEEVAHILPADWEMEIVESHHGAKVDAPSGTAKALGQAWTKVRGGDFVFGRSGVPGARPPKEVGIHAIRLPGGVGEHRALLGAPSESLELTHRAIDRAVFVEGTLTALRWLAGKPAGLYSLRDWVGDHLRRTGD
jgi:4-hydroxy-tetrahydrodipicolinate reductase